MIWHKLINIWRGISEPTKSRFELIQEHENGLSEETKQSLAIGIQQAKEGKLTPIPDSVFKDE